MPVDVQPPSPQHHPVPWPVLPPRDSAASIGDGATGDKSGRHAGAHAWPPSLPKAFCPRGRGQWTGIPPQEDTSSHPQGPDIQKCPPHLLSGG